MDKRELLNKKILSPEDMGRMVAFWHFKNKSISLAYGTFDVLKPGTIEMIIQAANKGDVLLVAIKPDHLVTKHKGAENPKNQQCNRALAIAAQMLVSGVYIVEEENPSKLVEQVKPAAITACKHATETEIKAFEQVKEWEGDVYIVDTDEPVKPKSDNPCCCE